MGNHEYCDECGEDDFHYGLPCNPEKKAQQDARNQEIENRRQWRVDKIRSDIEKFVMMGYTTDIDETHGYVKLWPKERQH